MEAKDRIKQLRKQYGLTQKELAKKANVSSQVVSNWERGYTLLGSDDLKNLTSIFGVTGDYILGLSSHPSLTKEQDEETDLKIEEYKKIFESLPVDERKELEEEVLELARVLMKRRKSRQ